MKSGLRSWIRTDGLLHIETSALIVVLLAAFLIWWKAAIIAWVIGFAKELYDHLKGGIVSWHDIGCDAAGVLIGLFISLL